MLKIICQKCGDDTHHHHYDEDIECSEENVILNGNYYCISTHHEGDYDWFFCTNIDCKCYHVACPKCLVKDNLQLCRFIGHFGCFDNGDRFYENLFVDSDYFKYRVPDYIVENATKDEFSSNNDDIEILNSVQIDQYKLDFPDSNYYPYYYIGDKNLLYADPKYIMLTGPDGGYSHYWKCPTCNWFLITTDK